MREFLKWLGGVVVVGIAAPVFNDLWTWWKEIWRDDTSRMAVLGGLSSIENQQSAAFFVIALSLTSIFWLNGRRFRQEPLSISVLALGSTVISTFIVVLMNLLIGRRDSVGVWVADNPFVFSSAIVYALLFCGRSVYRAAGPMPQSAHKTGQL